MRCCLLLQKLSFCLPALKDTSLSATASRELKKTRALSVTLLEPSAQTRCQPTLIRSCERLLPLRFRVQTATGDNVRASSVPSLSPHVAPAGGTARVNSPLPRPLVSSFGAISSWQPGNTSFSRAHLPGSRPGVAGWGNETPPSPSRASSASRQGAAAAASPASARPRTGGRSGPEPRCPRRQGAVPPGRTRCLRRGLETRGAPGKPPRGSPRARRPCLGSSGGELRPAARLPCRALAARRAPLRQPFSRRQPVGARRGSAVRRRAPKPGDEARRRHRAPRLQAA